MNTLPIIEHVKLVASEILPHVHSFEDMEFYTNHGISHSERVLGYIVKFSELYKNSITPLSEPEMAILDCACWLHDIGCILQREKHAKHSVEIIRLLKKKGLLNLGVIEQHVEYVVLAHSGDLIKLDEVEELLPVSGFNDKVRLRFLCALFKLADKCDITSLRAPRTVYEILKMKNMPTTSDHWWVGLDNIISVELLPEQGLIRIHMGNWDDTNILNSLKDTLKISKDVLEINGFPCTKLEAIYHPSDNIEED